MNDYDLLDKLLPRYIRINQCSDAFIENLLAKNSFLCRVHWERHFLCFPGCYSLSDINWIISTSYKDAGVFPMDISSSLAIVAMDLKKDSTRKIKVLDLCCSPGAKFQLISEVLKNSDLLVGVDISLPRIEVCKVLLNNSFNVIADKSEVNTCLSSVFPRQLIFQCDGTVFGPDSPGLVQYDSNILFNDIFHSHSSSNKRRRMNKSARTRERKGLKATQDQISGSSSSNNNNTDDHGNICETSDVEGGRNVIVRNDLTGFDYVLVDAECTHDASYRHMRYIHSTSGNSNSNGDDNGNEDTVCDAGHGTPAVVVSSGVSKPKASLSHTTASSCTSGSSSSGDGGETGQTAAEKLRTLQRGLLYNGFTHLAVGGTLVYSTCSQERQQNEEVVQWLLDQHPHTARLVPLQFFDTCDGDGSGSSSTSTRSDSRDDASPSDLLSPSALLSLSLPEIVSYASALSPSDLKGLSTAICRYCASRGQPVIDESPLAGTVRVGYRGGMSGHFIAKIEKIDESDKVDSNRQQEQHSI